MVYDVRVCDCPVGGASFDSTTELVAALEAFIKHYNETSKPSVWKKRKIKDSQIHDTLPNLCG
jgi:hypothetical protein